MKPPLKTHNNRPCRLSGTKKNIQLPSKWIDRTEKWCWIISYKYLYGQQEIFEINLDYFDKMY